MRAPAFGKDRLLKASLLCSMMSLLSACGTHRPPPERPSWHTAIDDSVHVELSDESPTPTIHRRLRIERSASDVFRALTAFDRVPEWIPSIRRAYVSSSGPVGMGTTFVEEFTFATRPGRFIGTVTEYEENRRLTYVYEGGPIPGVWEYTLTPVSGGTLLDFKLHVTPGGFFSTRNPVLFPIIRRTIQRNLESFRAWVEEEPAT